MAGILKRCVLDAAALQIKACLSEPLINHFWAPARVLSIEKSRSLVPTSTAAVYFYMCFNIGEN